MFAFAIAFVWAVPADAAYPPARPGLILFDSCDKAQCDLFTITAKGTDRTNVTNTPTLSETRPSISADGRRIAFRLQGPGQGDIWAMNRDGTGRIQLTNTPTADEGSPA